jgi:hypothetical protein
MNLPSASTRQFDSPLQFVPLRTCLHMLPKSLQFADNCRKLMSIEHRLTIRVDVQQVSERSRFGSGPNVREVKTPGPILVRCAADFPSHQPTFRSHLGFHLCASVSDTKESL